MKFRKVELRKPISCACLDTWKEATSTFQ